MVLTPNLDIDCLLKTKFELFIAVTPKKFSDEEIFFFLFFVCFVLQRKERITDARTFETLRALFDLTPWVFQKRFISSMI